MMLYYYEGSISNVTSIDEKSVNDIEELGYPVELVLVGVVLGVKQVVFLRIITWLPMELRM